MRASRIRLVRIKCGSEKKYHREFELKPISNSTVPLGFYTIFGLYTLPVPNAKHSDLCPELVGTKIGLAL